LIQQYRSAIDGQLSDRQRVIDHLLDVRLAAPDAPAIVDIVDRRLSDVPGLTTVENSWWSDVLDELDLAAKAVPAP
jgi:hypothetical protein